MNLRRKDCVLAQAIVDAYQRIPCKRQKNPLDVFLTSRSPASPVDPDHDGIRRDIAVGEINIEQESGSVRPGVLDIRELRNGGLCGNRQGTEDLHKQEGEDLEQLLP
jgi:hypothetical protein